MISDSTLIHRFTGSNRRYVIHWTNGEVAWFRARNLREARKIAAWVTARSEHDLVLESVVWEGEHDE